MRGTVETIRFSGAGLFFIVGAILALLAGGVVYSFMHAAVKTEEVLVVTRDLLPGAMVTENDLLAKSLPLGSAPANAVSVKDRNKLIGQRVKYGLVSGGILQAGHLIKQGSYVSGQVADAGDGMRAVTLPGELVPGLERLLPGDVLELTGVLTAGNTMVTLPLGTARVVDIPVSGKDKSETGSVLVLVKTDQVSQLALTMRAGSLVIAVPGHGKDSAPAPSMRLDALTGTAAAAAPANPAAAKPQAPPTKP
jgi:Flp pilus assembly protein CpaB